ncbi:MAG: polysaccharide deacetylase family protein [Candidatus Omnitrophica bacterium]|nr:polysaccharide deacetylase family protein [Candidatus Omnitrophota bacterium]
MLNILLFHNITSIPSHDFYSVTGDFFKALLNQIKDSSFSVKNLRDFYGNSLSSHDKSITFTFDDGGLSDYEIAFPLLKELDFRGSFFITASFVGKSGFMQWDMIRELKDNNMEIGSHTISHRILSRLPAEEAQEELYASRCLLEDKLGTKIDALSFPQGDFNKRIIDLAKKAGYRIMCTSTPGINGIKQLQKGILYRNSMNRAVDIPTMPSRIDPSWFNIILARLSYEIRKGTKRIIGNERYESVRNRLLGVNNVQ